MSNPRRAPTVRVSLANVNASRGPELEEYALPLDRPRVYRWVPGDPSMPDGYVVVGAQGGTAGNWLLLRDDERGADLGNADATLLVSQKRLRYLPASTLTGNHTATLGTTNAAAGDLIRVVKLDVGAFTYAVANGGPGAGTLTTLPAAQKWWFEAYFDGTNWRLHGAGQIP